MFEEFVEMLKQLASDKRTADRPSSYAQAIMICAALLVVAQRLDAIVDRMADSFPAKF